MNTRKIKAINKITELSKHMLNTNFARLCLSVSSAGPPFQLLMGSFLQRQQNRTLFRLKTLITRARIQFKQSNNKESKVNKRLIFADLFDNIETK